MVLNSLPDSGTHTFDHFFKLYNLLTSDADTCVYYRPTTFNLVDLIVGIFVDDGIVCASNPVDLDNGITHLASIFKVTHGTMDYYVGFQIHHDLVHHTIFINQARYILIYFSSFNLTKLIWFLHQLTHINLYKLHWDQMIILSLHPYLIGKPSGVSCMLWFLHSQI